MYHTTLICFIRIQLTLFCTNICFTSIALYPILTALTPAQRDAHHTLLEQMKSFQADFVLSVNYKAAVVTIPYALKQCSPQS